VGEEASGQALSTAGGDGSGKEKKLTNQFNFSERASQTYNNPMRVSASTDSSAAPRCLRLRYKRA